MLAEDVFSPDVKKEATRVGFGRGLLAAGERDEDVVAVCADLTASVCMDKFEAAFPERFTQVGVAEQNLVTVAAGMAAMGKIPFTGAFAAFCPGRCWEQIRTTICLNDQPVIVAGSHAGVTVGPDGATHQMLEDIVMMRALPNMIVIAPGDSLEAERATLAVAANKKPAYLRLARTNTIVFTKPDATFEIGKAYVLREGTDVAIMATGTMTYQALVAAEELSKEGLNAEVVHVPTIKPLDSKVILASASKCGLVVTVEEAQAAGGFGSAITELISEFAPVPVKRIGVQDRFGESGNPDELLEEFGLTAKHVAEATRRMVKKRNK
jgi:transketolase